MTRRDFLHVLLVAAAGGLTVDRRVSLAAAADQLYDVPPFGHVSLLHLTDTHPVKT